ncbi:DNA repair helicase [Hanseniaspora valbyensis NRRL Y-1626]|uniref:ATP-dependent DNA helicase CHL1 n=1 Tax=Hanseniaspora valbyensis NRRL Y-1626 TaxID=766949 RepID=A0A1B7TB12_9ASCO|nr:DNA repair helicase [Hanseniaspora valbyensis NRRL Y-1626]
MVAKAENNSKNVQYNHPYEPYDIQMELMNNIYEDLLSSKNNKIGFFESPTGTGKTLSLICSVMSFIRDNKLNYLLNDGNNNKSFDESDDEPDWITSSYENSLKFSKISPFEEFENKIENYTIKNFNTTSTSTLKNNSFLNDDINVPKQPIKVIFASRTHSQLQQFADQLKKVKLKSSFQEDNNTISKLLSQKERIKLLPIGSKRQLCCNKDINTANWSMEKINDRCQELRKDGKCVYFKNLREPTTNIGNDNNNNGTKTEGFPAELVYKDILDIEDLNELGFELKKCPYYGIKTLIESAEIVTLPYQLLFMDDLNIDLSNSIVIVDEAHNLVNTLIDMNKCNISLIEVETLLEGLTIYLNKFGKKLATKNKVQLLKLKKLLQQLIDYLKKNYEDKKTTNLLPFLNMNNNALISFMKTSNLAQKLQSYMLKENLTTSKTPILFKLIKFLTILTNNKVKDGVWYFENDKLNYLPFAPTTTVSNIISKCLKMILIGGTMQPFNQFDIIFNENKQIYKENSLKLELGHVIPSDNIQCHIISKFKFTQANRTSPKFMSDIGLELIKLLKNVPKGCIIFCQSYSYLDTLFKFWYNERKDIWTELNSIKKIFKENNTNDNNSSTTNNHSNVFDLYCKHIEGGSEAVLFSVFGGKLSEGINFEDDLARSVICLGVPYPNIFTFEMELIKKNLKNGFNEYIDNIVMRQVNQAVGRSIRHAKDYASIILIDERFNHHNIKGKLSKWLRDSIINNESNIISDLKSFFTSKN